MSTIRKNLTAIVAVASVCVCLGLSSTAHAQRIAVVRTTNVRILPSAAFLPQPRLVPTVTVLPNTWTLRNYGTTMYTPLYPTTTYLNAAPIHYYGVYSRVNLYDTWHFQASYPSYAAAVQAATSLELSGWEASIR